MSTTINAAYLEGVDIVNSLVADFCERHELPAIEGQR